MKVSLRRHPFLWAEGALSLLALILLGLFRLFPAFAEGFSTTVGAFCRRGLAILTGWLPFSLFELLVAGGVLYALFVLGFALAALVRRLQKKGLPRHFLRCVTALFLALGVILQLYALTLGPCYFRFSTAQHLGLDLAVSEEDVFHALEETLAVINETAPLLEKNEAGESVGLSFDEMKQGVRQAAENFAVKHPFYQSGGAAVKTFLSSPLMTYTHLSGVYGFFTGEANVNWNYPHFIVTATAAHETCHARGIAPENECNFLAAVILMEAEDPYLRYCGAAFVVDDLLAACRKTDRERANALLKEADQTLFLDYAAYSRFFEPYANNLAATVADKTNSAYLKAMGQSDGTVSYSRIIELLAAYWR